MSLIKSIKQQLGLSVTAANNFTLDASADNGTMKLARGNAGATTQDILTVAAGGGVSILGGTVAPAAGQVGEFLTSTAGPIAASGSGTFQDLLNINLSPGVWDVTGTVLYSATGVSTVRSAGLSLTSGAFGLSFSQNANTMTIGFSDQVNIPATRIVTTVGISVLLVGRVIYSSGTQNAESRIIQARRVA